MLSSSIRILTVAAVIVVLLRRGHCDDEDVDSVVGPNVELTEQRHHHHHHHYRPRLSILQTPDMIKQILSKHDYYRMRTGGANIQKLKWSDDLADMASEWGDRCLWKHGFLKRNQSVLTYGRPGQNLGYAVGRDVGIPVAVQFFMHEKSYYNYTTNTCRKGRVCAHYLQVVWSETREVGCSVTKCDRIKNFKQAGPLFFYICNYAPAGNDVGKLPYIEGEPCSQCYQWQICIKNMCSDPPNSTNKTLQ